MKHIPIPIHNNSATTGNIVDAKGNVLFFTGSPDVANEIVLACNNHDALVEALRSIVDKIDERYIVYGGTMPMGSGWDRELQECAHKAIDVLTKTKEGK